MTIQIPVSGPKMLTAYHHTVDGVKGYILSIEGAQVFVSEKRADELARYMLFAEQTEVGKDAQ